MAFINYSTFVTIILLIEMCDTVFSVSCYECTQSKPERHSACADNLPKYIIHRCDEGVSQCYTQVLGRHKFKRGCAVAHDPVLKACVENLMEDCRICDYDLCNGLPILMPMTIGCTQCLVAEGHEATCNKFIPSQPCPVLQLMTTPNMCFYLFFSNGNVKEKGCLTTKVEWQADADDYLLTCNGDACNELHAKDTSHKCETESTTESCEKYTASQFPGCYKTFDGHHDRQGGCNSKFNFEEFMKLMASNESSICFEKHPTMKTRPCNQLYYKSHPLCYPQETCTHMHSYCYTRYEYIGENRFVADAGCVDQYTLGLYSNMTYFCFNFLSYPSYQFCNTVEYEFACHVCVGPSCHDVTSSIEVSRNKCKGEDRQCYTLVGSDSAVVKRGCSLVEECAWNRMKCRVCEGMYCNDDKVIPNPLMCPKSRYLKKSDPLKSVVLEYCLTRTTVGIKDKCAVITEIIERKSAFVSYGCYFESLKVCSEWPYTCETAISPTLFNDAFYCYQCLSSRVDEMSCADEAQNIAPTLCRFVFSAPVRGCFARYNPKEDAIERGCASELTPFEYRRCDQALFHDCALCNLESCNNMTLNLDLL